MQRQLQRGNRRGHSAHDSIKTITALATRGSADAFQGTLHEEGAVTSGCMAS